MGRKPTYRTHVGVSVGEILTETGMSQAELAKAMDLGERQSTVSKKLADPTASNAEWLNAVAKATALSEDRKRKLFYAAAKDHGFILDDVDLTKP